MLRLLMITAMAFAAASLPARADTDVEVTLSPGLQGMVARIDAIEQKLEKRFRENAHYDLIAASSTRRFANSHYNNVNWANELLVPQATTYGVRNMLAALVEESLSRAGVDSAGMVVHVRLDMLKVSGHSLARLGGASSYARGTISLVDAASGRIVRSADITANLVIYPTADLGYKGPDFVFEITDAGRRVGPALAYFVMKGLGKLYQDTKFPRPVALSYNP